MAGGGRFLKTYLCVQEDGGRVIVKQYLKRDQTPHLDKYAKKIQRLDSAVRKLKIPHALPYEDALETDRAAYLVRQCLYSSLQDRISSHPFLTHVEKRWIVFQMLRALADLHEVGVCHGDIKAENVLVTSWNWVFLADFAPYKPVVLPADNPADFNFYFSTGKVHSGRIVSRQRCYLAPERFVEMIPKDGKLDRRKLTSEMDVFSMGCVIAELFLDGKTFLDYSAALSLRAGHIGVADLLHGLDDGICSLVTNMVQLNPRDRLSARECIQNFANLLFPGYFDPLFHNFAARMLRLAYDQRVEVVSRELPRLQKAMSAGSPAQKKRSTTEGVRREPAAKERHVSLHEISKVVCQHSQSQLITLPDQGCYTPRNDGITQMDSEEELCASVCNGRLPRARIDFSIDRFEESKAMDSELPGHEYPSSCAAKELVALPAEGGWGWHGEWVPDTYQEEVDHSRFCAGVPAHEELSSCTEQHTCRDSSSTLSPERGGSRVWKRERRRLAKLGFIPSKGTLHHPPSPGKERPGKEGITLVISLLCSFIRGSKRMVSKLSILNLLAECSVDVDDNVRLQMVVPALLSTVADPAACVRAMAIKHLAYVLDMVWTVTPSDARIFPEYILPALSMIPADQEELVRFQYARSLHLFADVSQRVLQYLQYSLQPLPKDGSLSPRSQEGRLDPGCSNVDYEQELANLRNSVLEVIQELILSESCTPRIRRGLIQGVGPLSQFFGKRGTNDNLLPLFITLLNDRDRQLREDFFENIWGIGHCIGRDAVGEFLLPCIEQAFSDPEDSVIYQALLCFSNLCAFQWLKRTHVLEMIRKISPLLASSNNFLRYASGRAVGAAATCLADPLGMLLPILHPYLEHIPVESVSMEALLHCLKPPQALVSEREEERHPAAETAVLEVDAPLYKLSDRGGVIDPDAKAGVLVRKGEMEDVTEGVAAAIHTGMASAYPEYKPERPWRPCGILIANFEEHRRGVNSLAVAPDSSYFVSASDDGTAKLWSTASVESDICFGSKATFGPCRGRAMSCALSESHAGQMYLSTSEGMVQIWDLQTSKEAPVECVRTNDGAVFQVLPFDNLLLYATQSGNVHAYDSRSGKEAWCMRGSPASGLLKSMAVDPASFLWLITGTLEGNFAVWDVRFQVEVHRWQHPSCCSVDKLSVVPSNQAFGRGRVYAAAGTNEVGRWDVATGKCDHVFQANLSQDGEDHSKLPLALRPEANAASDTRDFGKKSLQTTPHLSPGFRAMLPFSDGTLLSGGTDCRIRLWDGSQPDKSYVVCGPQINEGGVRTGRNASGSTKYAPRTYNGVRILQELRKPDVSIRSMVEDAISMKHAAHRDCIRDLAIVQPGRRLLLSGSRDGSVKCWV